MNIIENIKNLAVIPWIEYGIITLMAIVVVGAVIKYIKKKEYAIADAVLWMIPLASMLYGFETWMSQAWYGGVVWLGIFMCMGSPAKVMVSIAEKTEAWAKQHAPEPAAENTPAPEPAAENTPAPEPEPKTAQESESTPEDLPASEEELKDLENAFNR